MYTDARTVAQVINRFHRRGASTVSQQTKYGNSDSVDRHGGGAFRDGFTSISNSHSVKL